MESWGFFLGRQNCFRAFHSTDVFDCSQKDLQLIQYHFNMFQRIKFFQIHSKIFLEWSYQICCITFWCINNHSRIISNIDHFADPLNPLQSQKLYTLKTSRSKFLQNLQRAKSDNFLPANKSPGKVQRLSKLRYPEFNQ